MTIQGLSEKVTQYAITKCIGGLIVLVVVLVIEPVLAGKGRILGIEDEDEGRGRVRLAGDSARGPFSDGV
ncbi:hypothetical protein ACFLQR_01745 [Verrucomicrobiota bacterium]